MFKNNLNFLYAFKKFLISFSDFYLVKLNLIDISNQYTSILIPKYNLDNILDLSTYNENDNYYILTIYLFY